MIVFATDRSRWYPESRFMRKAPVQVDGTFMGTGLPFGTYYAAAIARMPAGGDDDWSDPAFLETLLSHAQSLTLAEGRKRSS